MSNTFSTLRRALEGGRVYSSQYTTRTGHAGTRQLGTARAASLVLPEGLSLEQQQPSPAVGMNSGTVLLPPVRWIFHLTGEHVPVPGRSQPGASGTVTVQRQSDGTWRVVGQVAGMSPLADPAIRPVLWLIHDLPVPVDLSPQDLAQLPKGRLGVGNQPGEIYTLDGNPPTYGPGANTLSISISPGAFNLGADGVWHLEGRIDEQTNQAFHPLAVLGPSVLADLDAPMPSGVVARTLTDLFMRPATVRPDLTLRSHFPQRLTALLQQAEGDPTTERFVDGSAFMRAAVTLEGLVRGTPRLMPTRDACFLIAMNRTEA